MTDYELAWSLVIGWISLCIVVQLLSESRRGQKNIKSLRNQKTPYKELNKETPYRRGNKNEV